MTFNYDRLLEYRLIRGLGVRYNKPHAEVWTKIEALRPIHIYGSLGFLPEILQPTVRAAQPLPFGSADGPLWFANPGLRDLQQGTQRIDYLGLAIDNAETSINIVHDAVVDERRAAVLQHLHMEGKQIFFFGFAFGRQNVDWLQTRQIPFNNDIWMTTYGMTDSEFSDAVRPAFPQLMKANQWFDWGQHAPRITIKQFLRNHVELFRQ